MKKGGKSLKVAFRTTLDSELLLGLKKNALQKGKHVNEILDDLIYSYLNHMVSQDEMDEINRLRKRIRAKNGDKKIESLQEHISYAISRACWETGYKPSYELDSIFENLGKAIAEMLVFCADEIPLSDEKK